MATSLPGALQPSLAEEVMDAVKVELGLGVGVVLGSNCQHSHLSVGRTVWVKVTAFARAVRPALIAPATDRQDPH